MPQLLSNVLVVGATGFVGSYITKTLLEAGINVVGTCRFPVDSQWLNPDTLLQKSEKPVAGHFGKLEVEEVLFPLDGTPIQQSVVEDLVAKVSGVVFAAGHEKQEETTINFMTNAMLSILRAAEKHTNADQFPVVLISSTGSTNKPGADPKSLKEEHVSWSDPELQQKNKRFSPAAKTLMEINALAFVGRNQQNEVVDEAKATGKPRLCILNPSLILGPQLKPGKVEGNGLPWFAKIVSGEAMSEQVPNDSMSIIHAGDLAKLAVGLLQNEDASGRYFGVYQSWPWDQILTAIKKLRPSYELPPKKFTNEEAKPVTVFDNARRDVICQSAGIKLRGLEDILSDTMDYLQTAGQIHQHSATTDPQDEALPVVQGLH